MGDCHDEFYSGADDLSSRSFNVMPLMTYSHNIQHKQDNIVIPHTITATLFYDNDLRAFSFADVCRQR